MNPEKYIIIPIAHNYVSVDAEKKRLGGDSWMTPHIDAVKATLHDCLDFKKTIAVIADKAYSGPKVLQGLSDMLAPANTITTYDAFGWLDENNKKELFDTQIARPQTNIDQVVFVVVSCSNALIREFLQRKTNFSQEQISKVQDDIYTPENGKIYIINNIDETVQYL